MSNQAKIRNDDNMLNPQKPSLQPIKTYWIGDVLQILCRQEQQKKDLFTIEANKSTFNQYIIALSSTVHICENSVKCIHFPKKNEDGSAIIYVDMEMATKTRTNGNIKKKYRIINDFKMIYIYFLPSASKNKKKVLIFNSSGRIQIHQKQMT